MQRALDRESAPPPRRRPRSPSPPRSHKRGRYDWGRPERRSPDRAPDPRPGAASALVAARPPSVQVVALDAHPESSLANYARQIEAVLGATLGPVASVSLPAYALGDALKLCLDQRVRLVVVLRGHHAPLMRCDAYGIDAVTGRYTERKDLPVMDLLGAFVGETRQTSTFSTPSYASAPTLATAPSVVLPPTHTYQLADLRGRAVAEQPASTTWSGTGQLFNSQQFASSLLQQPLQQASAPQPLGSGPSESAYTPKVQGPETSDPQQLSVIQRLLAHLVRPQESTSTQTTPSFSSAQTSAAVSPAAPSQSSSQSQDLGAVLRALQMRNLQ